MTPEQTFDAIMAILEDKIVGDGQGYPANSERMSAAHHLTMMFREAIREEREACAKIAESYYHQTRNDVFKGVAAAIRSRIQGETE